MPIKTASLKEIKSLPKGSYIVIIMRYFPWWARIKNKYDLNAPELSPNVQLLQAAIRLRKRYGAKYAWVNTKFDTMLRRQFNRDPKAQATMKLLKTISNKGTDVYLICKEDTDEYCHRRVVKEIIDKNIYVD